MRVFPTTVDSYSKEYQDALTKHFVSLAPTRITHFITVTLHRGGNPYVFNKRWKSSSDLMNHFIIKAMDDEVYGKRRVAEADRFPRLSRGETVEAGTHAECHLHFHLCADLTDRILAERFEGRSERFERRVRANFRKLGVRVAFHYAYPAPGDRQVLAEYMAKACWVDAERFYSRNT